MRKVKLLTFVVAVSFTSLHMPANALSFGNTVSPAILNRPLEIQLPLLSDTDDFHNIRVTLANDQQHQDFGIQYPEWMPNLKFDVIQNINGNVLEITSTAPITEPVVNFVIAIEYQELTLFKEIVVFLDPAPLIENKLNVTTSSTLTMPSVTSLSTKYPSLAQQNTNKTISTNRNTSSNSSSNNNDGSFIVERGQTLWSIAKNWDVKGVTIHQKVQAIFLSNQHAFMNADENQLMQGSRLTLATTSLALVAPVADTPIVNTITKDAKISIDDNKAKEAEIFNLKQKTSDVNHLITKQQALNTSLKNQIKQLEENFQLQQALANVVKYQQLNADKQKTLPVISNPVISNPVVSSPEASKPEVSKPKVEVVTSTTPIAKNIVPELPKNKPIQQSQPYQGTSNSIWITTIWFFLALLVALLGSLLTSKRKARVFAKKLEDRLQDMAYNHEKTKYQAPSLKELSIPKNLSTPVQIKYLNSAADFYLRCNRYDLAKELVNEGLMQFSGNTQIIRALNNIRKKIFSQLDININGENKQKQNSIGSSIKKKNKDTVIKEMTIEEIDHEWARLCDKKAS